jgi:hypothetical protein
MRQIVKEWQSRIAVHIDRVQVFRLKTHAKQLGIKHTHLVRILIDAYLSGNVDIDEYKGDWLKD